MIRDSSYRKAELTMTTLTPHSISPATSEVYDRQRLLQLIEDALRGTPYCACGALMTVSADGDTLWLECPTFQEPTSGRLSWLRNGLRVALHERQLLEREMAIAA
jgi:hypothetical protein